MGTFIDLDFLDNPNIININTLPNHSDHHIYFGDKENKISLNGKWRFAFFPRFSNQIEYLLSPTFDINSLEEINVPSHFELNGYGKPQYVNQQYPWYGVENVELGKTPKDNPVGVYFKDINLDRPLSERLVLEIGGFNSSLYVYINGNFLAYSEKNFTETEIDLTKYLKIGINRLALIVFKYSKQSWFLDQDMWRFGGIFRDVYLKFVPYTHIFDIDNKSFLADDYQTGVIDVKFNLLGISQNTTLRFTLSFQDNVLLDEEVNVFNDKYELKKKVTNVSPRSSEIPSLYLLKIELKNQGEVVESTYLKIGFRNLKIVDGVMLLNGQRLILKGVNRHEFEMHSGRAISDELIKQDLLLLKANNFNAIRTSHYPNRSYLYELADELGFYLIDEVDLETHGTWATLVKKADFSKVLPGNHIEFENLILAKDNAIYERDKNHPSILMWSLGNESSVGSVLKSSYKYFKEVDPFRLVHYEGCYYQKKYSSLTDVDSSMYIIPNQIEKRLENQTFKPYILCEFEHSMGNSTGNFDEYWALTEKFKNFQGGFIWDFVDQGILEKDSTVIKYGGDFDDRPNDGVFSCDGLLLSDRSKTSKLDEVKYFYQDIKCERQDDGILIKNTNLFKNTNDYYFKLTFFEDGVEKSSSPFTLFINPNSSFFLKLGNLNLDINKEILVRLSYHLAHDTEFSRKDYEVGFFEFLYTSDLKHAPKYVEEVTTNKNNFLLTNFNFGVKTNKNISYLFSGIQNYKGGLTSIKINNQEFVKDILKPTLFRPTTDNDENISRYFLDLYKGISGASLALPLNFKRNNAITMSKNSAKLTYFYRYFYGSLPKKIKVTYEVLPSGDLLVGMSTKISLMQFAPGEIGLTFEIPFIVDNFTYYGLGKGDNYIDRFHGQKLGIYTSTPLEEYVNYAKPQECGQHLFTRYLILSSKEGNKLGIYALDKSFAFKVLPWSAQEIENATHLDELPKIKSTFVTILCATRGVGGDNSWLAPVHKKYKLKSGQKYELKFIIKKVD